VDPSELSIIRSLQENNVLPSKGYSFRGKPILIELKFIRGLNGAEPNEIAEIQKDIEKAIELNNKYQNQNELFMFVVIFSKTNKRLEELNNLNDWEQKPANVKCLVHSIGLDNNTF
jgi:beta-N-acetylglucosaminidase